MDCRLYLRRILDFSFQTQKSLSFFLLTAILLTAAPAFSAITITGVSGGSYTEQDGTNAAFTLYGGMVRGSGIGCVGDGSSPCNSCINTGTGFNGVKACNLQSVYPDLSIAVTFSVDTIPAGGALVRVFTDASGGSGYAADYTPSNGTIATAGTYSMSLKWSYLCQHDQNFGSSSCAPNAVEPETAFQNTSRKIYVWVDENGNNTREDVEIKSVDVRLHYINGDDTTIHTQNFCVDDAGAGAGYGVCGFTLDVGDSKLYVSSVMGNTSPTPKSPDWYGVALIAAPVSLANISNSTSTPQIQPYNASGVLTEAAVTGLTNYTEYCVLLGNVNKAQNIYKFSNGGAINSALVCASPSEVVGMLSDKSCFISTAAFGSDMDQHVQLLRKFRNEFLLTNEAGTKFVKMYYKLSPPIANFIEKSEMLKAITRTALYPVIGATWLVMKLASTESDKK